jgi:hypothetical protein
MMDHVLRLLRQPVRWVPWVLAALPALWMVWFVLQGSQLQYSDYWDMLPRTVSPTGWISFRGVTTFQNEHPVVIPQFLIWANVHLTGGSNIALGLFVVLVVAAQVVLISRFVERDDRHKWVAASIIVVASVLLFSRQGVHNFSKSMSGTAWLTANLFVIAAILARWKDKTWLAAGFGVAASITYGTGLVVWPVLIIVGMLRDRRWWPDWRIILVGAFAVAFYLIRRPESSSAFQSGPRDLVKAALAMGSAIFTDSIGAMRVATVLGLLAGVALIAIAVWKRNNAAIPWIGLFLYGILSLGLISRGRLLFVTGTSFPSRYASIAAVFWIGLVGLAGAIVKWKSYALLPAAAVVLASVTYNSPAVDDERDLWLRQEDLAAGIRLDLTDDRTLTFAFRPPLTVTPLLEKLGHYPFNGAWNADCGLLDTTYDPASATKASSGSVEKAREMTGSKGVRFRGLLPDETESPIKCVVVGNEDDKVIGVGTLGVGEQTTFVGMAAGSEDPSRLAAIAPRNSSEYHVLLVLEDGSLLQLGEPIADTDVTAR